MRRIWRSRRSTRRGCWAAAASPATTRRCGPVRPAAGSSTRPRRSGRVRASPPRPEVGVGRSNIGVVRQAHFHTTRLLGALVLLLGIAMVVSTLARGGGPLSLGVVLGVAFAAAGAGRLYLAGAFRDE